MSTHWANTVINSSNCRLSTNLKLSGLTADATSVAENIRVKSDMQSPMTPTSHSILSLDICMALSWSNVTESGNHTQGRYQHLRSTVEKGGFGGTYPHGN